MKADGTKKLDKGKENKQKETDAQGECRKRKQAVFTGELREVPFILQVSKHKCLPLFLN